jgi:heavy metal sensor kinase
LTAWYAALLALVFVVVALVVWLALRHSIVRTVDKELRARLATVRAYVEQEARGPGIAHLEEELGEDAVVTPGAINLRIADISGTWIYRSPGTADWHFPVPARSTLPVNGQIQTAHFSGASLRVLTAPVVVGTVQLAAALDEFEELQKNFVWTIVTGLPVLLLIASAGGYWLSGRALRPVEQIASAARRISAENLSERLPCSGTGDELDRLSGVLNEMLGGLEAAFRRVTQFTADASHELRTPVSIIRTTAEVIRARPRTSEEQDKAWAQILAQTDRTSQLIEDMLILARADSRHDGLHFEALDLKEVVEEAYSEMHLVAQSKRLQFTSLVLENCPVSGDRDALRRVLLILLDNAIKATAPDGAVEISLEVKSEPESQRARVLVKDSGIGIDPEDLPHIFDRFYRAHKDRSRETGGAGLGLSIAAWVLARHGGVIQVESKPGAGSTFKVDLPIAT